MVKNQELWRKVQKRCRCECVRVWEGSEWFIGQLCVVFQSAGDPNHRIKGTMDRVTGEVFEQKEKEEDADI